ncbi:MAG: peptidase T [Acholeplasmatales bacterium]|nr:peptidase T [Acholeplasmatales bacterium]
MTLLDRFLKYVKIDTMSDDKNDSFTPSTEKQYNLAYELEKELNALGLKNVHINKYCTVYATLPANAEGYDSIGFLAHMDTIPEVSGTNVKPNVVKYDGTPIKLGNTGLTLNEKDFPWMKKQIGHTLVTTDGTTVLGCDDKGGIAVIMTMLDVIISNNLPHGEIHIAFTPDEEIGTGVLKFDVSEFPVKYAYTIDGGDYEEFSYETFNASSAHVEFKGFDIHPGAAKGKMINASRLAIKFDDLLPEFARPEYTELYEGFNHLHHIEGEVGHATSEYIIRNHDLDKLEAQKEMFKAAEAYLNSLYPNCCKVTITDSYKNMRKVIEKDMTCVNKALEAYKKAGIAVSCVPTRGGTDGSRITFMGIPTPNLGTGGYNEHGVHEYADMFEMENMVNVAINIATTK